MMMKEIPIPSQLAAMPIKTELDGIYIINGVNQWTQLTPNFVQLTIGIILTYI